MAVVTCVILSIRTFDELYQRIIDLITILSENTEQEIEPSSQNGNEEYPF